MFWVSSEQLTERVLLSWQILTRGSLTACRSPCPHQPWSSCSYKTRTWCVLFCLRHIWPYHRFFIITEAAHRDQVWLFGSPDGNKGEKVLKTSLFLSLLTVPGATLHFKYRMGNCGKMGLGWSWTRGCQPPPQPHVSFKCTLTEYSHWLKWHLIVFAAQRMSSHTRYPFCLCQKLTSGSVTLSEALREVWKGLAGFSGSVLSCWWQMHQDKAALGGRLEPQNWSCWKLWCSHVSAQTLHGHRILVCSYTTITLALNGDVFTSYSLRFCWEQLYPSSAFRFFFFFWLNKLCQNLHKRKALDYPDIILQPHFVSFQAALLIPDKAAIELCILVLIFSPSFGSISIDMCFLSDCFILGVLSRLEISKYTQILLFFCHFQQACSRDSCSHFPSTRPCTFRY